MRLLRPSTVVRRVTIAVGAAAVLPSVAGLLAAGLAVARDLRPDAITITLDIMLPGYDGGQVMRALKADAQTAPIPVVIISMIENRNLGLLLGAEEWLAKPYRQHTLVEELHRVVQSRRATAA